MKKKVAAPATSAAAAVTPAPAAVAAPKVTPKKAPAKLAVVPTIPATASRTQRRAAAKTAAPAEPVVEKKLIPIKKTATANLSGTLASISQARHILHNSRSFGEAMDVLGRLESQAREQLGAAITDELKKSRVNADGHNIGTESKPDGVYIVLSKQVAQPQ